jgi:hypothetical protein
MTDYHQSIKTDVSAELLPVLQDIAAERTYQVAKGWTTDHDDTHYTQDLVGLAFDRARMQGVGTPPGVFARQRLVQAASMLVAAIEAIDRRDQQES